MNVNVDSDSHVSTWMRSGDVPFKEMCFGVITMQWAMRVASRGAKDDVQLPCHLER